MSKEETPWPVGKKFTASFIVTKPDAAEQLIRELQKPNKLLPGLSIERVDINDLHYHYQSLINAITNLARQVGLTVTKD